MTQTVSEQQRAQSVLFYFAFFAIVVLAIFLRVYDISLRPLHSDEGVNYHFLQTMTSNGFYRYSHENYHGPAYFYVTYFFTSIFGYSDLSLRGSSILFGVLTVLSCLLFLKTESKKFVILSAFFCATSSAMVFKSRYAIHETLFTFSGFYLALGVLLWHRTRAEGWHLLSGLGLGLLIATKETFIIYLFCIFFAFLAMADFKQVWVDLLAQKKSILLGLFLSILIILISFTGGLQWSGGLREMFLAVPQWIGRNESDVGHFKPFLYYSKILLGNFKSPQSFQTLLKTATEPQLYFVMITPILMAIFFPKSIRAAFLPENATGRFLLVWTFLSWLVYSCVSYKTPWLIINISLPAALLLAWVLQRMIEALPRYTFLSILTCGVVSLAAVKSMYTYNFLIPYGSKNPFSYVHTHQGMMQLLKDIGQYSAKKDQKRVLVGTAHYWPLPYYLREYGDPIGYQVTEDAPAFKGSYDILILDSKVKWDSGDWVRKYYRLSDVQETFTYFRR